jgi:hypothetical protein
VDQAAVHRRVRWRFRVGSPWQDVPAGYAPWQSIDGLFRRWRRIGTWDAVLDARTGGRPRTRPNLVLADQACTVKATAASYGLAASQPASPAHPTRTPAAHPLSSAVIARRKRHRGVARDDTLVVRFQAVLTRVARSRL